MSVYMMGRIVIYNKARYNTTIRHRNLILQTVMTGQKFASVGEQHADVCMVNVLFVEL